MTDPQQQAESVIAMLGVTPNVPSWVPESREFAWEWDESRIGRMFSLEVAKIDTGTRPVTVRLWFHQEVGQPNAPLIGDGPDDVDESHNFDQYPWVYDEQVRIVAGDAEDLTITQAAALADALIRATAIARAG